MAKRPSAGSAAEERFLTTRQVADRLQVSVGTVRRMAKAGDLKESRPGHRTIRYRAEDVDAALATTLPADQPSKDEVNEAVQRVMETFFPATARQRRAG